MPAARALGTLPRSSCNEAIPLICEAKGTSRALQLMALSSVYFSVESRILWSHELGTGHALIGIAPIQRLLLDSPGDGGLKFSTKVEESACTQCRPSPANPACPSQEAVRSRCRRGRLSQCSNSSVSCEVAAAIMSRNIPKQTLPLQKLTSHMAQRTHDKKASRQAPQPALITDPVILDGLVVPRQSVGCIFFAHAMATVVSSKRRSHWTFTTQLQGKRNRALLQAINS